MAKLLITYKKSAIGYSYMQKETIRSLGLKKLNSTALHDDTPSIRGMVFKVRHLVTVQEVAESTAAPAHPEAPKAAAAKVADGADDLKIIEGIGPKIAGVLQQAGISTFAQLAEASVEQLTTIMQEAKLRLANPETWAEQAALAAAGKWGDLKDLQNRLNAGRRSE
jgi:ribosomal protein L30